MDDEYRVIPGYNCYSVNKYGIVKSIERDLVLSQYFLNGYKIVDTFRGSKTETLPVHRAVALAWVENKNPSEFNIVNHLDGDPINNYYENLEWTNASGNNYHAVNNGLRRDNIPCMVRDFYTKEVKEFSSMQQAAEFMGVGKTASFDLLRPKMFGKLVSGRFEFRFSCDPVPWFYENRTELVSPSRYMVIVTDEDGKVKEIYSNKSLLQEYQLYGAQSKSIPNMVCYANIIYPNLKFEFRDSYEESRFRVMKGTKLSVPVAVIASKENINLEFTSLTKVAKHFGVDRSTIINRLNNDKLLNGWKFTQKASLISNG